MAKKPALGLSITDTTLEALALGTSSGKYYISNYAWLRLPNGIVKNGKVVDSRSLAIEIRKLMASARPKPLRGPVVLGLPQSHVFLKVFTLPEFEGKDLEEAINWHIDSLSPMIPESAYSSYEVAGKSGSGEIRVLLAAAQEAVVDAYIEALNLADVEIAVIEPMVIAKTRLINPKQLLGKSVVSLHLYGRILTASILVNAKVWFSRESLVTQANERAIKLVVTEIVGYFVKRKEKDVPDLTELLYYGDHGGLEILEKNLANMDLDLVASKAEAGVVLEASRAVSDIKMAAFAPVLGLALRGSLDQKGMISLLPKWPKERTEMTGLSQAFSFWLTIAVVLVWLGGGLLVGGWWWLKQEHTKLKAAQNNIEFDQEQEKKLSDWRNQFNEVVKGTQMILTSQTDYERVLSSLAALTPKEVTITTFVYRSLVKEWSITGVADKREDVLVFDRELKNSEIFTNTQLFFSSLDSDEQVIFRFIGGGRGN